MANHVTSLPLMRAQAVLPTPLPLLPCVRAAGEALTRSVPLRRRDFRTAELYDEARGSCVRARGDKPRPGATYAVAGFCARYANEPAENCCAQLTEQTRSREYKSSDQRDHERKQHKVTQEHEHTYALFFISQSCPPKDLPSARFATLEPQNSERYLGTDLDIEWRASRGTA